MSSDTLHNIFFRKALSTEKFLANCMNCFYFNSKLRVERNPYKDFAFEILVLIPSLIFVLISLVFFFVQFILPDQCEIYNLGTIFTHA